MNNRNWSQKWPARLNRISDELAMAVQLLDGSTYTAIAIENAYSKERIRQKVRMALRVITSIYYRSILLDEDAYWAFHGSKIYHMGINDLRDNKEHWMKMITTCQERKNAETSSTA